MVPDGALSCGRNPDATVPPRTSNFGGSKLGYRPRARSWPSRVAVRRGNNCVRIVAAAPSQEAGVRWFHRADSATRLSAISRMRRLSRFSKAAGVSAPSLKKWRWIRSAKSVRKSGFPSRTSAPKNPPGPSRSVRLRLSALVRRKPSASAIQNLKPVPGSSGPQLRNSDSQSP